jgi:hypothetical protein
MASTTEHERLQETRESNVPWRKWGPYVSERQWGTVREDYSDNGDAWNYFTHDQARSRAYRWGEDGLAGICDDQRHFPQLTLHPDAGRAGGGDRPILYGGVSGVAGRDVHL